MQVMEHASDARKCTNICEHFQGVFPCTREVAKLVLMGKNDDVHLREYGDDLTPDVR